MMNWIGRKARTFRINQAEARVVAVEQRANAHDVKKQQHVESLQRNFKEFCEQVFGFTPFSYQLDLEAKFNEFQFNAVRWPRQTGKSFIVSGLMLKYAIENPNSYIAVVGPSWRQTKLNVRRIGGFARKYLGCDKGIQKTMVSLPNGSVIEAFPNNPDTIRGPTLM
jgi:phage terminase large subunit-like protein